MIDGETASGTGIRTGIRTGTATGIETVTGNGISKKSELKRPEEQHEGTPK